MMIIVSLMLLNEGMLQKTKTVCDDGFTKEEVVVVCWQLWLLQTEGMGAVTNLKHSMGLLILIT